MFHATGTATTGNLHLDVGRVLSFSQTGGASWFYREFVSSEKKIENAFLAVDLDAGEARPAAQTILGITRLVEVVSKTMPLSAAAEVSVFYGEASVTWRSESREVSIISSARADGPKLLRYVHDPEEQANPPVVANATAEDLRQALRWLYR